MESPLNKSYHIWKKRALEKYYNHLNDMQRRAVFQMDGPLLILAGAGSGKTTVLINRIENMVRFGCAYTSDFTPGYINASDMALLEAYANGETDLDAESLGRMIRDNPAKPWNVLAITFTNKAAGELKSRLAAKLGSDGEEVQASTFHSLCVRILRREIEALGYARNFTIYDTDDSLRVVKGALKQLNIDEKVLAPRAVLGEISRAKDGMVTAKQMLDASAGDFRKNSVARVYEAYQHTLKTANALDFDDIIMNTVRLFQQFPDVLEHYQNRYRYIMVDEYQDTNHTQYLLVSMLAGKHRNLCVVGDDDQSIYKFRGATIENILSFEKQFLNAAVIRLEQNYRSTQNILSAANKVIANNLERKGKNLWTSAGGGEKVIAARVGDETDESRLIADEILNHVKAGAKFSDHAILYRINAQSNTLERALAKNAIPYRIVGGLRFYERKEIKDIVAYLSVLNNHGDTLRLLRIINEPKRGIGAATLSSASEIAETLGISLFEVIENAGGYAPIAAKAGALTVFTRMIEDLTEIAEEKPLDVLLDEILLQTGYLNTIKAHGIEGEGRIENIMELKSNMLKYRQEAQDPSLSGFLEEIALYTDLDNYDTAADSVTLMTVHSAKGLEFRHVFIAGMDEGIFPGRNAMNFPAELEEERRLAYVAITRAKERLMIVSAERRMLFGQTIYSKPSRFIGEIPSDLLEIRNVASASRAAAGKRKEMPAHKAAAASLLGVGISAPPPPRQASPRLVVGDTVSHKVFGTGKVLAAKPMAADMLLEIDFKGLGVKKIMANFARLEKL